jgi:hypothetical protein
MAYAEIHLTNGLEIKKAPVGFSWTTFFFGPIPALLRQDWMMGGIILGLSLFFFGFVSIVFAFFYNKMYIKNLFKAGYTVHNYGMMNEDSLKIYLGYITLPTPPSTTAK